MFGYVTSMDQLETICNFMHFNKKVIILLKEMCRSFLKDISPKESQQRGRPV